MATRIGVAENETPTADQQRATSPFASTENNTADSMTTSLELSTKYLTRWVQSSTARSRGLSEEELSKANEAIEAYKADQAAAENAPASIRSTRQRSYHGADFSHATTARGRSHGDPSKPRCLRCLEKKKGCSSKTDGIVPCVRCVQNGHECIPENFATNPEDRSAHASTNTINAGLNETPATLSKRG